MTADILALITRAAADMNPALATPIDIARGADAPLFGPGAPLDSMALVRFIVEIEALVEDETGTAIILASERAMSQRRSPFLTLGSLAAYVNELLAETTKDAA
jgi:hypothetical protein